MSDTLGAPCSAEQTLRVLLFSPLPSRDPLSGDTSYTEALLTEPPDGVRYTTYEEALADGTLRVWGLKPRNGGWAPVNLAVFLWRAIELTLRRAGLMFREPVWYVSVCPDTYDVVHQHLFAVRQIGRRTPVVSSAGYPLGEHYRARDGWGDRRIRRAERLEQILARWADVHTPWLYATEGSLLTVYTKTFRTWLVRRGVRSDQVRVVGTGLASVPLGPRTSDGHTLGVIARDFHRKGGDVALAAFHLLRQDDSRWRLLVATSGVDARAIERQPALEVVADAPREAVLSVVHPRIDILLAPTRADCGVPYAVLEALQGGTPIVTSDIPWLDERLAPPGAWRVELRPEDVADAVRKIVMHGMETARVAARELWVRSFSMEQLGNELSRAYRDVQIQSKAPPRRVLVVAPWRDLADNPYDAFAVRHRELIRALAATYHVDVLLLDSGGKELPTVPGIARPATADLPPLPTTRSGRLRDALRAAKGLMSNCERALAAAVAASGADVAVTVGPWHQNEYRPVWNTLPTVHLFEEDLTQMIELAPQSRRARWLRGLEWWLHAKAKAQPRIVVSISQLERRRAERRYPQSKHEHLPFTLDPISWPRYRGTADGQAVIVVGNLNEERNAEGLADVLRELSRRKLDEQIRVELISGPGLHSMLEPFLVLPWVLHRQWHGPLHEAYRGAWAALVPARRVTGQKTTILQAWACGVPVVASRECAATVGADGPMAIGNDAVALVDHLLRLRGDHDERRRLVERGLARLDRQFDREWILARFTALVARSHHPLQSRHY